ncbi:hypothetical protein D3C76_1339120 [compost metagenome]
MSLVEQRVDIGFGQIDACRFGASTAVVCRCHERFDRPGVGVGGDEDIGPFGYERLGDGSANAVGGSGDQCALALESAHWWMFSGLQSW